MRRLKSLLSLPILLLLLLQYGIVNVNAYPEATLRVSLPNGTRIGANPDPWLSEGWLLNITGTSGTFVVRVNQTSASQASYMTRLIVAINNEAYENLLSLVIEGASINKSDFGYGVPTPFGKWTWPDDVYPTWFSDLYMLGTIPPKGFVEVSVSVNFSNSTNVRLHFDAYGSVVDGFPCKPSDITWSPHSEDSTVLFYPIMLQPPYAEFVYTPDFPQVCEIVTFNASLSHDPDGFIVNYRWDFGDGNVTELCNAVVTHHYGEPGAYAVNLTVTDNDGLSASTIKNITIRKHPVAAFIYSPDRPKVCEEIVFNATASTPDGGCIVSYEWDFGDCSPHKSGVIVTHHYTNFGNYTVTLNVTDSEGKWDTESKIVTVSGFPSARFTWSPESPQVCEIVTFNASESAPNGGCIVSYEWDFGDCSTHMFGVIVTHHYTAPGNYTVTLNVTDSEGFSDVISHNITVRAHPHADFTYAPIHPKVFEIVTFNASASTPDGGYIIRYEWDFGDCSPHEFGMIAQHRFQAAGNYTVTLNVTDSEGKWDVEAKTIVVCPIAQPPTANFTWYPPSPQVCEMVTFNASLSTPDGGCIVSYEWDFGDCSPHELGLIVTHHYANFGNYTVTLKIMDSEGLVDFESKTITVRAYPKANFTYSPLIPYVDQTITFNASSSTPDGGYLICFEWDFGDCSPHQFGIIVTHSYSRAGSFTVTLNVTDSEGKWDTISKVITVSECMPKPPMAKLALKIEGEWTWPGHEYGFDPSYYCKTFEVQVWVLGPWQGFGVTDLYAYEFWVTFNPNFIQIVDHEIKHIHTQDFIILEDVNNTVGVYKQALTAISPAVGFNGTACIAILRFHVVQIPCYPSIYMGELKLINTKMSDSCSKPISHDCQNGYFTIVSRKPRISVQYEGGNNVTKWIVGENFTVDIVLNDVVNMKSFYMELEWCDCLETSYQKVNITDFLPPPYEVYEVYLVNNTLRVHVKIPCEKPPVNGTGIIMRITFKVKNPWPCSLPEYYRLDHEWTVKPYICEVRVKGGYIDVYCPEYREMRFYDRDGVDIKNLNYIFKPIPGDLNFDGHVEIADLVLISQNYGSASAKFDLNRDGIVDLYDVVIVAKNYCRRAP